MHGPSTYQNKFKHDLAYHLVVGDHTLSDDMVFAHDSLPFDQIPFLSCRARPTLKIAYCEST